MFFFLSSNSIGIPFCSRISCLSILQIEIGWESAFLLISKLVRRHIVNLFGFQAKSDKESLVEAAAKEEEEEEEYEEEEEELHHQGERGKGKKELKKTKSNLRFGCIPKKPPKEKVT